MGKRKAAGGTPATVALDRAGVTYLVRAYEHDPRSESYGLEAAAALDVEPERVFKTLVVSLDPRPGARPALAVAVIPVAHRLDLKALARTLGVGKVAMADVADAERATGYVVGGISPVGQRRRLPTVVDSSAHDHATVLVSAGRRGMDLEIAPADLVAVTGAVPGRVSVARS